MTGKEQSLRLSITISGGTGTGTITNQWSVSRWFRVVPVAESDTYDVTVKDGSGYIILKRTSQLGTLSENLELSLGIAKTVLIENASQNGTYTALFDMH